MRSALTRLTVGACLGLAAVDGGAAPAPGTTLDRTTAEEAKDLLPPEILRHYRNGDYRNAVVEFPNSRWRWDDGFEEATRWNAEHLVLDEHKAPVDKATGKRPDYITGLPFPDIREDDPDAGYKVLWNVDYAYYTGGNSRNLVLLSWVGRSRLDRSAVQDVRFLYYDGQPKKYSPPTNADNLLFQFLALSTSPADLQGTAALGYRYKDPTKRDMNWAYVPALRRVRAVSPANRSDGFLGSDTSQDDGFFFDGKPAGFQVKGWPGVAWAPVAAALAKRRFWILEGVPKDKYYLYGRLELWVDDYTWQGAWNRKFSWQGELLNVYQVTGFATAPFNEHESWWGATFSTQFSENVKGDRATVAGLNGPGQDPPNDRRLPLDPVFFDYQTLNRFGK